MANSYNNYLGKAVLDHVFGNTVYTAPTTLYFALLTAPATVTDTAATMSEATYTGYVRTAVTNNDTNFSDATSPADLPTKKNAVTIEFSQVVSGSDTITDVAIVDSASGAGNILVAGALTESKPLSALDKLVFEPNNVTITQL